MRQNLHTHSTYCDGKNSIRDMIETAIEKKFDILGFSGHGYMPLDNCSMSVENTRKYIAEVIRVMCAKSLVEDLERLGMHNISTITKISANNPYSELDYDTVIYSGYQPDDSDYLEIEISMPLDPDTCKPITFSSMDEIKAYITAAFANEYIAISIADVDMYIENMLLNHISFDE